MIDLDSRWDLNKHQNEANLLALLTHMAAFDDAARNRIVEHAATLVKRIRAASRPELMDIFLAEYGLSTDEGIALMCLAEALLRVPDADTTDALIEDKIAQSDWSRHMGQSNSKLVNAATWGLVLARKILQKPEPGITGILHGIVRRLGRPIIRVAINRAMREMGRQFVLAQDINAAIKRAQAKQAASFTYSYDMLGEAATTAADAARYTKAYREAISVIATACTSDDISANPGISVKLSALHPRYEVAKIDRVMAELVPVVSQLARQAAGTTIGLNIDAEEADRLGLSLKVIEAVLCDPELDGWDGFGVVVQAYGRRVVDVIDGLHDIATRLNRRIMVRLVKGAYWDTEIKHAQVEGLEDFPVFTRKSATDVSYLAAARKLLGLTDRIYPQFATHNAHTVAAILEMANGLAPSAYEFQRLHGMGETLHDIVHAEYGTRCRIYAPVGAHGDLLAYLVRRLLENSANSSFVNQIVDESVPAHHVVACPFQILAGEVDTFEPRLIRSKKLFAPERQNSNGFDLSNAMDLARIHAARKIPSYWRVAPIIAGSATAHGPGAPAFNPATGEQIGEIVSASAADVEMALTASQPWDVSAAERAQILNRVADLYEDNFGLVFALLATEAGKTLPDAVAELREAVDFLRYYAAGATTLTQPARGVFTCISPWNFPLAIFTGQIAAALAAGNAVIAKPAETTSAIASWGVRMMHSVGVPRTALQFLPGLGRTIGTALTSDSRINGVAFTGSTHTARRIQRTMAEHCEPGTPLIAETGGLNAMVIDSTALPEQAIRDVVVSAFQSAGQRCSALRCLYVQEDIAPILRNMLIGAMNELQLGDPWALATDIGPVITAQARDDITAYVDQAIDDGRMIHRLSAPNQSGTFIAPSLIAINGINEMEREVFGPVLHMATFKAHEINMVIDAINAKGFGLTFGLHTRIDSRVQHMADGVKAGNIYANRNQIGAVVGSQPFGGEGLSGTGPKAGGPHYLTRFTQTKAPVYREQAQTKADPDTLAANLRNIALIPDMPTTTQLPGPTGESNQLSTVARAPLLCLAPGPQATADQVTEIEALGGKALAVTGILTPEALHDLPPFGGVIWWGDGDSARAYARALSNRSGPIIPLITCRPDRAHAVLERHLCVDVTAAGGNVSLFTGRDQSDPDRKQYSPYEYQ